MTTTTAPHVIVIGGGIAGLSAARALSIVDRECRPRVTLLEASPRLGGIIGTERVDRFVIDRGPDSFLTRKPGAVALCQALGLGDDLVGTDQHQAGAFVLWDGRLHPLPEGLSGLVPTRLAPLVRGSLLSATGKLRAAWEPFVSRGAASGDESVASFIRRRFGRQAYDRVFGSLIEAIYAGHGEEMSAEATLGRLREWERRVGSLVRGLRREGPSANAADLTPFASLKGGMVTLVERLAEQLPDVIVRLSTPVMGVDCRDGRVRVRLPDATLDGDAAIVATPAHVSSRLFDQTDPDLASLLASIPFVSTATVALAYRRDDVGSPLRGHGYVVPRAQRRRVLACSWTSSKFPDRAPAGSVLLRVFLGWKGGEVTGDDDETIVAASRAEIEPILGVSGSPVLNRVYRHDRAMPQYTVGHLDRLAQIEERLAHLPGVCLAGQSYRGLGLPDCIRSGEAAARDALTHLQELVRS